MSKHYDADRVCIQRDGKTVASSRNLRGILGYARKCGIRWIRIERLQVGGRLTIKFYDDADVITDFADFSVLCGFLNARRTWRGVPVEDASTCTTAGLSATFP